MFYVKVGRCIQIDIRNINPIIVNDKRVGSGKKAGKTKEEGAEWAAWRTIWMHLQQMGNIHCKQTIYIADAFSLEEFLAGAYSRQENFIALLVKRESEDRENQITDSRKQDTREESILNNIHLRISLFTSLCARIRKVRHIFCSFSEARFPHLCN